MGRLWQILRHINRHPLAKRHRLRAYFNFFRWQVSQAIYAKEKVKSFVGNTKLVIKKGMTGATGNIYTGLRDFNDMGFLLHFLQPADLFF